jgi:phosphatidylglycerophosphatase A
MSINKKFLFYLSRLAEAYPIGHSKYAPGTIGSLIGVLFGSFLILNLDVKFYLIFLLIFIIVSYLLCEAHLKFYNKKDPKEVVVDEISGQFIAILGCVQSDKSTYMFLSLLLSFVLFRFFDITKIGPIKRFENLPNGIGIMADDIVAGLFALVTQAAILTSLNQNIYIKTLWN